MEVARRCVKLATSSGANDAAVVASQSREVTVQWRDGMLERMHEATSRGVTIELYVNGRYGAVRTGDLRPEALESFISEAVVMTRAIAPDPFRTLPDPKYYAGQSTEDLETYDASYSERTPRCVAPL